MLDEPDVFDVSDEVESSVSVELPQLELSHEDELVQKLLEPVDIDWVVEDPVLLPQPVPDVRPRLLLPVEDGPLLDEPVLVFVPDRL